MNEHTSLPWLARGDPYKLQPTILNVRRWARNIYVDIPGRTDELVARAFGHTENEAKANANFIVAVVNSHDRLIELAALIAQTTDADTNPLQCVNLLEQAQDKARDLLKEMEEGGKR